MKRMLPPLLLAGALLAPACFAQGAPSAPPPDSAMQVLRDKLMADKKLVVSTNLDLTPAEASAFWPLYEAYQKDLQRANSQLATVVANYAKEYNANTLTDEKATRILREAGAADDLSVQLRKAMAARLVPVLPGRKLARYLQIENKIHAVVMYEIAAQVPLAP
jgi:hypothetical protein